MIGVKSAIEVVELLGARREARRVVRAEDWRLRVRILGWGKGVRIVGGGTLEYRESSICKGDIKSNDEITHI